jgi:hypothetical protein
MTHHALSPIVAAPKRVVMSVQLYPTPDGQER